MASGTRLYRRSTFTCPSCPKEGPQLTVRQFHTAAMAFQHAASTGHEVMELRTEAIVWRKAKAPKRIDDTKTKERK